jgi:broad specificity phosphatase PhoE
MSQPRQRPAPDAPLARLLLIRHGETEWNVARRFQGHRDSPLTARGLWQAARVAERLRALPVAALSSSDLPRTLATAEPIAAALGLPVRLAPAFREANFGDYEGATYQELVAAHGAAVERWASDPIQLAPPGGETMAALQARVATLIRATIAAHPGETVALVGHGGSVRAAVMEVLQMDLAHFRRLRMDNAGLTAIEGDEHLLTLTLFNDIAHLAE